MAKMTLKGQALAAADTKHKMVSDLHRLCIELAGVPEEKKSAGGGFFKRRLARR